ncbi:TRAP transporter small permease subunit [Oceanomicrobium pacificus]|uniref:TRAP transporter small permease protein n=1 Tax=Oceanomicrobium pacificus TaxID=2692916 RepID=A0A6B0TTY3_9RHOB|nr:TRAP transporter small permease [Oceanomicrobium pacificus]MXU65108.1 TRAP transporter small permease subunit [Oceanomicrobium pacificus]
MVPAALKKTVTVLSTLGNGVAIGANVVGTLVVLGLVLIVNYDVVARGVFNAPFHGAVELVQFSMVLVVFLQLPDVVRVNRLTRSDGFLAVIGHSRPKLAAAIRHVIDTVSAIFMTLIAVAIWPEFTDMWESKDYFGVPGVFTAPWWPIKLVIFLSATLCAVIFALKVLSPAPRPERVRLPEHEDTE